MIRREPRCGSCGLRRPEFTRQRTVNETVASSPQRAAIIGAGLISDIHIRGLQGIGVEVVAVVDTDLRRAQSKAEQHGVGGAFASQREMLDAVDCDVVHILTPPSTHAELCIEALEAGVHVYIEKPMAPSVEECDRMIGAAERTGRQLCVGHSLVFDPLMLQALEAIEGGEIGEIIHASAVYCFDPKRIPGYNSKGWYRQLAGGFVEDLASHPASVLLRVIGAPAAVTPTPDLRPGRAGNQIAALVQGERGTGSLLVSLDARPEEVSLDIRGTRGTIRVSFSTMVVAVQRERNLPKKLAHGFRNLEMATNLAVQTVTNTARFVAKRMDTTKGIHTLIGEFYRAIEEGRPAPVSGEQGREVVRLLRDLWPEPSPHAGRPKRWVLSQPEDEKSAALRPNGAPTPGDGLQSALVTGATGFIGTHLVRSLAERGVRVRALARDPEKGKRILGPNVEVVIGDFADPEVIEGLAEGVDTIFHLASVMAGTPEEFQRVDLAGSRHLLDEAKRVGVRRFVYTSTLGVYPFGDLRDGALVSDSTPVDESERIGPYSAAKIQVERMLMEATRQGEIEGVVVRPGLVFGPGTTPYLTHLPHVGTKRGDRYIVYGDGEVPLALTYVGNVVDALILCATSPEASGETFLLVDDDVPTQREFVHRLARLTGEPLQLVAIPRAAVGLLGFGVESAFRIRGKKPKTTRRLLVGKSHKFRFDAAHAKRVLGWEPRMSWEEGLRRNVRWWERAENGGRA
jgi:nucleoside-diphosphate-sugar epimerase/predicted dehydrogenase